MKAVTSAIFFTLALCASAQAAKAPGVTSKVTPPALRLDHNPAVRAAVLGLVGYDRGSYTDADGLIVAQVLAAMNSKYDITRTLLPDGRQVLASINPNGHGSERAAMLQDAQGGLLALGLVNGHCRARQGEAAKVCDPGPRTTLTVFLPAGADPATAAPLLAWSRDLPELLALLGEQGNPEQVADAQAIAKVEYVRPHTARAGWSAAELPPGWPAALTPLLLPAAEISHSSSAGKVVLPKGLAGLPMRTAWQLAQNPGEQLPDVEVGLFSYADFAAVAALYTELAKGARVEKVGRELRLSGNDGAGRYSVRIRAVPEGVHITVGAWRPE
ncbi:hypothetical protein [Janthinobacterium sp.]|uniref:hypothetical protein n=1 Tax=Janthinobacterium sp. TaxID=1871054 RepID=UPI00293D62F0|nr:hypothetical protein [Janthinobacterium sp.]